MIDDDENGPGHTHKLPRAVLLTLFVMGAGLVASIVLVSVQSHRAQQQAMMTDQRLQALEQFIESRGVLRDQQYATLDDRITAAVCDVLDGLPAGGLLDPIRAEYKCKPGVPVDQLPPAAQQQLQQFSQGLDIPAVPQPAVKPRQSPQEPSAQPAPATSTPAPSAAPTAGLPVIPDPAPAPPTTPPLVDLTPITDQLCDALGVCL